MKNLTKFIAIVVLSISAVSVNGQVAFTSTYSDNFNAHFKDAAKLLNGDVIIVADYYPNVASDADNLFLRLNSQGDIIWQNSEGATNDDYLNRVIGSSDSGFVAVGRMGNDGFIAKYNSSNSPVWERHITYFPSDTFTVNDVVEETPNNYRIMGSETNNTNSIIQTPFLKLDYNSPSGTIFYLGKAKHIDYTDVGGYPTVGKRMAQVSGTAYVVAGNTTFSSTYKGIYIGIIDTVTNNLIYHKSLTGPSTGYQLQIADMTTTQDKQNILLAGNISGITLSLVQSDGIVTKLDHSGAITWCKKIPNFSINKIFADSDNSIFVVGYIPSGSIIFHGYPALLKLSSTGDVLWTNTYNVDADTIYPDIKTIVPLGQNNILLLGDYVNSSSISNLFIAKVDSIGNGACNTTATRTSSDYTSYLLNDFIMAANGGVTTIPATVTYAGGVPYNGSKTQHCLTGIADVSPAELITVFPNPATNEIKVAGATQGSTITIYNLLGMQQQVSEIKTSDATISLNQMAAGMYIYNISKQGAIVSKGKLLIER